MQLLPDGYFPPSISVSVRRGINLGQFEFVSPDNSFLGRTLPDHLAEIRGHAITGVQTRRADYLVNTGITGSLDKHRDLFDVQHLLEPFDQAVKKRLESRSGG